MPKGARDWGVVFTDDGLNELGNDIKRYLHEGKTGLYLFCRKVDMSLPYLRLVVDYTGADCDPFEIEFYVPHHYVKLIASSAEQGKIGFL